MAGFSRNIILAMSTFSKAYRLNRDCVKINAHNTLRHEKRKFEVCWWLKSQGKEFYTEVIFNNNRRADIVCPETLTIYEVLASETKEECLKKVRDYPGCFTIVFVDSSEPWLGSP